MTYRQGTKSPVNIWLTTPGEDDVQVAMARTSHQAQQLVEAANGSLAKLAVVRTFMQTIRDACQATTDDGEALDAIGDALEQLDADFTALDNA